MKVLDLEKTGTQKGKFGEMREKNLQSKMQN